MSSTTRVEPAAFLIEESVTPQELELLQQVRDIQRHGWGELRVIVERHELVRYVPAPMKRFGEPA